MFLNNAFVSFTDVYGVVKLLFEATEHTFFTYDDLYFEKDPTVPPSHELSKPVFSNLVVDQVLMSDTSVQWSRAVDTLAHSVQYNLTLYTSSAKAFVSLLTGTSSTSYLWSPDSASLADGYYILEIMAYDGEGRINSSRLTIELDLVVDSSSSSSNPSSSSSGSQTVDESSSSSTPGINISTSSGFELYIILLMSLTLLGIRRYKLY